MKTWRLMMGACMAMGLVVACTTDPVTEDDEGTGGSGATGGGTTTSTGGPVTSTGGPVTSTSTGMMACAGNPFTFNDPTCGGCLETNCCDELEACGADQTCVDCAVGNETDPAVCDANAASTALDTCTTSQCSAECPVSVGICDSGFAYPDEACATCLGDNCCADFTACFNDANCNACLINQDQAACDAGTLDEPVDACFTNTCPTECGG